MKRNSLFLLFFTLLGVGAFAQSKDEEQIRRLEIHWTQLLEKEDTTALRKVWTKNYVVNNPNGKIATVEDIIGLIRSKHKFPAVERIIEKITFNQNIAVVMGTELAQPEKTNPNLDEKITRRFTNIWIKSKAGWQLAARQATGVVQK